MKDEEPAGDRPPREVPFAVPGYYPRIHGPLAKRKGFDYLMKRVEDFKKWSETMLDDMTADERDVLGVLMQRFSDGGYTEVTLDVAALFAILVKERLEYEEADKKTNRPQRGQRHDKA